MIFLGGLLQGISFVPALVHGVEALLSDKTGAEKRQAVLTLVHATLGAATAVEGKRIADDEKFNSGLQKMIDGVVECMNASVWAK